MLTGCGSTYDLAVNDALPPSGGEYTIEPWLSGSEPMEEADGSDHRSGDITDTAAEDVADSAFYDGCVVDYYDENQITPKAGLLTAGEWNDNDNWNFWQSLYNSSNYNVDWGEYLSKWKTGTECRAAVTVTDSSGNPIEGASVEGIGYNAVTDNSGKAYLFCKKSQLDNTSQRFTVTAGDYTQTFDEEMSGDAEFEFVLDNEIASSNKTLDLMIMCDTTGSMSDELEYLKCELENVVTRIKQENQNIPVRISVNFYRDEGDTYIVRDFPFISDIDEAVNEISQQTADGGGDNPEAVHEALDSAVNHHEWNNDSVKIMFLVLDAPPHDDEYVKDSVTKYVRMAAAEGIRIIPVSASGVDKSCEFLLRNMAFMTGGTYVFLTDDSGIGNSHTEPTIGSYNTEKLNDLMVRAVSEYLK